MNKYWKSSLLLLTSLILFSGCSKKYGIDMVSLKTPEAIKEFQKKNGKIGAYALRPILAKASLYLNRPIEKLESKFKEDTTVAQLKNGDELFLNEGVYVVVATGSAKDKLTHFGTMTFRNNTPGKSVLILETINEKGKSQGFIYAELDSGDMYETKHNDGPGLGLFIWFREILGMGTVTVGAQKDSLNIITAKLEDAFEEKPRCRLIEAMILRNSCQGDCIICEATDHDSFFLLGNEPSACSKC